VTANVVVVLGPARSGKTQELLDQYRVALASSSPVGFDRALWLSPNSRVATQTRERLIDGGLDACLSPGIVTFDNLCRLILADANVYARALTPFLQRELLRRVLSKAVAGDELKLFRESAGRSAFVDLVAAHIGELKRQGIRPDDYAKAAERRQDATQHRELARIYAIYEGELEAHDLLDAESVHWAARDALAENTCRRFKSLELVVVDGFTDFTPTQHEILRCLAERSKRLCITLPADVEAGSAATRPDVRPDLFAKAAATLDELKRRHPGLEARYIPAQPILWPALDHIAKYVFRNPVDVPVPAKEVLLTLENRFEIVETAGAQDEIVQIARRIKQLLSGVPGSSVVRPGNIVVVFRSLGDAAPRVREVFEEFGIPFSLESSEPLRSTSVVKTLLALLQLDREDWPFRRVVSVLTNNTLTALDGAGRQRADWLVRELQIAGGREKLLERVKRLAELGKSPDALTHHAKRRAEAAAAAEPVIRQLAAALDLLPLSASSHEWSEALARMGAQLGLEPFLNGATRDPAQQSIVANLIGLQRLGVWLGESREYARADVLQLLLDLANHEKLPRAHDDVGRVRVLSATTARGVTTRHLFLAGMTEQAFPAPEGVGRLATDADYSELGRRAGRKGGTDKVTNVTRGQAEMLLFYEVLTRADESLTISYASLDDKAQVLPPSPYLTEITRVLDTEDGEAANWSRVKHSTVHLSPVPDGPPRGPGDLRVQAVAQAMGEKRDLRLLAAILADDARKGVGDALEASLQIVHERAQSDSFGPAEGIVRSPAVRALLAQRYGADHPWSPSQFELYAMCPYKFYLANVLRLEPLGDLVLETDFARRGSLLHYVLAKFHRDQGQSAADWADLCRDDGRFIAELQNALQQAVAGGPRDGIDAALFELDRRQIEKWIGAYRDQHEKYDAAWPNLDERLLPRYLEVRFGPRHHGEDEEEDSASIGQPYLLDIGGEEIRITGRIDRIDVGRTGERLVFTVIDYKSGARPTLSPAKMASGERLQPALYVMAAEALLFAEGSATPLWAGYWSMKNGITTNKRFSLECSADGSTVAEGWDQLRPKVVEQVGKFVHAIRGGEFPIDSRDAQCTSRCEFSTVCRVAQIRSLEKKWWPQGAGDA
jgi:ATP-dependent helicase/nuclease subunit B